MIFFKAGITHSYNSNNSVQLWTGFMKLLSPVMHNNFQEVCDDAWSIWKVEDIGCFI